MGLTCIAEESENLYTSTHGFRALRIPKGYRLKIGEGLDSATVEEWHEPWTGEGLPPNGTICELRNVAAGTEWARATVVFASRNVVVWDWDGEPAINGLCTAYRHAVEMRPIRTPEQIAAEEREKELQQIEDTISFTVGRDSRRYAAEAIYDAGYRKQEPNPE